MWGYLDIKVCPDLDMYVYIYIYIYIYPTSRYTLISGSTPIHCETCHIWEDVSYVGYRLFLYGMTSQNLGRLATYGRTSLIWEDFPLYPKTSHRLEDSRDDFSYLGRLPTYSKPSHVWEDFPEDSHIQHQTIWDSHMT
jgi:hypothetical protein